MNEPLKSLPLVRSAYSADRTYTHVTRWGRDTPAGRQTERRVTAGKKYELRGSLEDRFYVIGEDGLRFPVDVWSNRWHWPQEGDGSENPYVSPPGAEMEIRARKFNQDHPQDTETLCREGTMFTTRNLSNTFIAQEKNTMLKIERVVLINGERATTRPSDAIIGLLEMETRHIQRLEALNLRSAAINKIKVKHQKNIDELLEVLETMEEDK